MRTRMRVRDKLSTSLIVLDKARKPLIFTHLMYKSNTDYVNLKGLLALLSKNGYIQIISKDNRTYYLSTEKGVILARMWDKLFSFRKLLDEKYGYAFC